MGRCPSGKGGSEVSECMDCEEYQLLLTAAEQKVIDLESKLSDAEMKRDEYRAVLQSIAYDAREATR